jgi:hypothetical protein
VGARGWRYVWVHVSMGVRVGEIDDESREGREKERQGGKEEKKRDV